MLCLLFFCCKWTLNLVDDDDDDETGCDGIGMCCEKKTMIG